MTKPMGYRNQAIVKELAADGMLSTTYGGDMTFDPMQYAVLDMMASMSFDWPADSECRKREALPRVYNRGWLTIAQRLGMTYTANMNDITTVKGKPRHPKKEAAAIRRISTVAKRLQEKGMIKCLRKGNSAGHDYAVWLLTIGDPDENAEVEEYALSHKMWYFNH